MRTEDWEGCCEECHMVGEHDRRCPVLAELRQERADHMRKAMKEEDALAGLIPPPKHSRKPS